jgi:hypothetical protein
VRFLSVAEISSSTKIDSISGSISFVDQITTTLSTLSTHTVRGLAPDTADYLAMTNPNAMAVPPSNSPGLIRLRLPSQASTNSIPSARLPQDSSPQLVALEQSLRQLIQSLLETAIMVHDLEDGSGELLFQKMYLPRVLLFHFLVLFVGEYSAWLGRHVWERND